MNEHTRILNPTAADGPLPRAPVTNPSEPSTPAVATGRKSVDWAAAGRKAWVTRRRNAALKAQQG